MDRTSNSTMGGSACRMRNRVNEWMEARDDANGMKSDASGIRRKAGAGNPLGQRSRIEASTESQKVEQSATCIVVYPLVGREVVRS